MSTAVKTLAELQVPFAMRGGGHMPIGTSNNINSTGVLISSSNMKQLQIGPDHKTVTVGSGNVWLDVYKYLEPYGQTVVGGRLGPIGVPGFLLGGGMSFFSNQYGFGSANVAKYTCVLGSGEIVEATANNMYADLFWALRGGGNSFALVASFDLKTYSAPVVSVGSVVYGPGVRDKWLDAVYTFAHDGSKDAKAALIPTATWGQSTQGMLVYNNFQFYDGNHTNPPAFENFSAPVLPALQNTVSARTMYQWTLEDYDRIKAVHGMRNAFYTVSLYAKKEAMEIVHDTWFETAKLRLSNVTNFLGSMALMPITERFISAGGRDPMGIDASQAPYIWVEESLMWSNPADDKTIDTFLADVNKDINAKLDAKGLRAPYLYLNDAYQGQQVFERYPKVNLAIMKGIRAKYDPQRVLTDLMPGGWKVEHASIF
ncbi:putative FAD binding domain protein [Neofusicoccum parvum]|nr:putative FAD binding domain protein [Neofusicoccum parvum]